MKRATREYTRALRLAEGKHPDRKAVRSLLEAAIAKGDPRAENALGSWYLFGVGVKKDTSRALRLLTAACRSGVAEACFNLAVSREKAGGTSRALKKAYELYARAAILGDRDAQFEVGRCLFFGIGCASNKTEAMRWYARSARRGHAEGMFEIGRAYEFGEHVRKSVVRARSWYEKAALSGIGEAKIALRKLNRRDGSRRKLASRLRP